MLGEKWQIDVKYVTSICLSDKVPLDKKYYQYTCIDEAARERFYIGMMNILLPIP